MYILHTKTQPSSSLSFLPARSIHFDWLFGSFENMEFEYTRNTMQGTFDFVALETRLHKIKEQLVRSLSLA